jgi:hypothetical protein
MSAEKTAALDADEAEEREERRLLATEWLEPSPWLPPLAALPALSRPFWVIGHYEIVVSNLSPTADSPLTRHSTSMP